MQAAYPEDHAEAREPANLPIAVQAREVSKEDFEMALRRSILLCLCTSVLFAPATAHADPIVHSQTRLVAGHMTFHISSDDPRASVFVSGTDFSADLFLPLCCGSVLSAPGPEPPGTVNPSLEIKARALGQVAIGNHVFSNPGDTPSTARFQVSGRFIAPPQKIPAPGQFVFTFPFMYAGAVDGPGFREVLVGQGTGSAVAITNDGNAGDIPLVGFNFGPGSPVPEPGSLALAFVGLVLFRLSMRHQALGRRT
jgi:hypothetical protein